MSITRGNAEEYKTDEMTVSGRNMSIGINEQGYYIIKVDGVGDKPELCDHIFTSLMEARKAVSAYVHANQAAINKKKMIMEIAERDYTKKDKGAKTNTE